jgi:hypothetical protein
MAAPIHIKTTIGEDRRLIIDLPPDTPIGPAELVIHPAAKPTAPQSQTITRDQARAKLLAAGFLVTSIRAPEGTIPLTPEELLRMGQLPPGSRPSEELIDEDRGAY